MPSTPHPATIAANGAGIGLRHEPATSGTTDGTGADGEPARLRLKPPGRPTGRVDGAWWPRSDDLAAELPALLAAVADRLGPVETVTYPLTAWSSVPRRLSVAGRRLRLAGYHSQGRHTVDLVAARRQLTLLVVPPASAPDAADRAFTAALDDDGGRTPEELLG